MFRKRSLFIRFSLQKKHLSIVFENGVDCPICPPSYSTSFAAAYNSAKAFTVFQNFFYINILSLPLHKFLQSNAQFNFWAAKSRWRLRRLRPEPPTWSHHAATVSAHESCENGDIIPSICLVANVRSSSFKGRSLLQQVTNLPSSKSDSHLPKKTVLFA